MTAPSLADWLLSCVEADEEVARTCAEMFPSPWEIVDRGWRVRIYAADVPTEDLISDDDDAMTVRQPVVMEVEPDRHIQDPKWLSERVDHIATHDPARVLANCAALRAVVALHKSWPVLVEQQPEFEQDGDDGINSMTFRMSKQIQWLTEQEYRNKFGTEPPTSPVLRALAAPFAGRAGWRGEWA